MEIHGEIHGEITGLSEHQNPTLHWMIIPQYGDGSKPYPPGEHQNSW